MDSVSIWGGPAQAPSDPGTAKYGEDDSSQGCVGVAPSNLNRAAYPVLATALWAGDYCHSCGIAVETEALRRYVIAKVTS
jgi:hypothetical protein